MDFSEAISSLQVLIWLDMVVCVHVGGKCDGWRACERRRYDLVKVEYQEPMSTQESSTSRHIVAIGFRMISYTSPTVQHG